MRGVTDRPYSWKSVFATLPRAARGRVRAPALHNGKFMRSISTVGAVYDRAFFVDSRKNGHRPRLQKKGHQPLPLCTRPLFRVWRLNVLPRKGITNADAADGLPVV